MATSKQFGQYGQPVLALISQYMYNAMVVPNLISTRIHYLDRKTISLPSRILLRGIHVVPLLLIGFGILQEVPKSN
jgi:hypothetical protein